jgi:hypothetical protein
MNRHRVLYLVKENADPRTHYRNAKHFVQRGRKGYDSQTWWKLDYAIADLIVATLPKLMKDNNGTSMVFFEDGDFKKKDNWNVTAAGQKRAEKRRQVIYGKILAGMKIFIENGSMCTKDEQAQIDEALQLLAKYFGTLWD